MQKNTMLFPIDLMILLINDPCPLGFFRLIVYSSQEPEQLIYDRRIRQCQIKIRTKTIKKAILNASLLYGAIIGFTFALMYWGI